MTSKSLITCMWFDGQAEEAAHFYASVFKDSSLGSAHLYNEAGPGAPGSVMLVEFELNGQKFVGLNGGPMFKFSEAVSVMIPCADQAEIDYYWNALIADGGEESQCGWLKDKYGFSWQVVPEKLFGMLSDPDEARRTRVSSAVYQMRKLDVATLEEAYAG